MQPPNLTSDLALFLDFDGTLVPIAPTPDSVIVPEALPRLLDEVLQRLNGAMAIVSGRGLNDVFSYLAPYSGPGAGSHGLELRLAENQLIEPDADVARVAAEILGTLKDFAAQHEGLIAEEKSWSASIHYRNNPALEALCIQAMADAVAGHAGWEVTRGKMVAEARPSGVSKATAVDALMEQPQFVGRVPVFIGDDVTDEDGMRAAMALGGYGIKVGPGTSVAQYRIEDTEGVLDYLGTLEN